MKTGHSAKICYWRYETDADVSTTPPPQAFNAQPTSTPLSPIDWILDTGTTNHVTTDLNDLSSYAYTGSDALHVGNGQGLSIQNIGSCSLLFASFFIKLLDVLHVPLFSRNLISVSRLLFDNPSILMEFYLSSCLFKDLRTKAILHQVTSVNGLFHLIPPSSSSSPQAFLEVRVSSDLWHARLGYPSHSTTLDVISSYSLPCTSNKLSLCQHCCMTKAHKLPFNTSFSSTTSPLELVHSDV